MGSRGPLRNPLSIRGQRENRRARRELTPEVKPVAVTMPGWLPEASRGTWERVLSGLRKASVPLQSIDGDAVGFYVACIDGMAEAMKKPDAALMARFERDAIQWANQIGASPAARALLR